MSVLRAFRRFFLVCSGAAALACGTGGRDASPPASGDSAMVAPAAAAAVAAPAPATVDAPAGVGRTVGFRSAARLDEHFTKHGREFGTISRAEYLRQAQTLRDAPLSATILEVRRPDGVVSRFDRQSGAFLAFDTDGIIRTFFRPNDGEAYFRRQASRRPNP